ncbi:hypothetical protein [Paraburkholderia xenovorans]|uniref:hypothetical protein n=1 Tax=Paraburkholderia xenovorans TaxID=36873 RepID=UPI0038BCA59D
MRRDKKLAEEILHTLVVDEGWTMSIGNLIGKLKEKADDAAIRYHVQLLADIGMLDLSNANYIRVTSAGQDRAENRDTKNPMATWAELGA